MVPYEGAVEFVRANLDEPAATWQLEGTFGHLVMVNSLYTVNDPRACLSQIITLAAPGAKLVISAPKAAPDMTAVLTEHLRLVAESGGDAEAERQRVQNDFAGIMAINRQILSHQTFHFADQSTLLSWFDNTGWSILSLSTTYAGQNWLALAHRSP